MPDEPQPTKSSRLTTSDDLEVAAYLEIARERSGQASQPGPPPRAQRESVLVIDFGSQYSQLIARRVRESSVYCEIVPHSAPWESVAHLNPMGIILSGGPASVYEDGAPLAPAWVYDSRLPVLGICYGMQAMVHQLGGKVAPAAKREYGHAVLHQNVSDAPIFHGLPPSIPVWMSHGDQIAEPPPGFAATAYTDNSPVAVIGNGRGMLGIQFHPEVAHTPQGRVLLENFLFRICGCRKLWTAGNFVNDSIQAVRDQVGDGNVNMRPVGRRGLRRGGHAGPPGRGRPAHLHIRRQRPDAPGGAREGAQHLREVPERQPGLRGRLGAFSRSSKRDRRPRREAQDHRGRVHRRLRRGGDEARRGGLPWSRAPSTRT